MCIFCDFKTFVSPYVKLNSNYDDTIILNSQKIHIEVQEFFHDSNDITVVISNDKFKVQGLKFNIRKSVARL